MIFKNTLVKTQLGTMPIFQAIENKIDKLQTIDGNWTKFNYDIKEISDFFNIVISSGEHVDLSEGSEIAISSFRFEKIDINSSVNNIPFIAYKDSWNDELKKTSIDIISNHRFMWPETFYEIKTENKLPISVKFSNSDKTIFCL